MKYTRLIVGGVILFSLLLFLGSSPGHESEGCFNECGGGYLPSSDWGYIEVWNDTAFHIGVIIKYGENSADTFVVKHDPGMFRKAFISGHTLVLTYIIDPILKTWKYHAAYTVNVAAGQNVVIRVKGGSLL